MVGWVGFRFRSCLNNRPVRPWSVVCWKLIQRLYSVSKQAAEVCTFVLYCLLTAGLIWADPQTLLSRTTSRVHQGLGTTHESTHYSWKYTLLWELPCLCADRKMVSTHLPLAWTHSSALEEQKLLSLLEDLAKMFQPHWGSEGTGYTAMTNTSSSYWPQLMEHAPAEGLY